MAVPALKSSIDEMKLDGAVRDVVSAINYAQSIAIKEGEVHGVQFKMNPSNTFRCFIKVPGNVVLHPAVKKPFLIDFKAEGYLLGLIIISSTLLSHRISFNDLGEASSSGTIVLGYAGLQRTITISTPTGMIGVN